jgi:hypothetical protein
MGFWQSDRQGVMSNIREQGQSRFRAGEAPFGIVRIADQVCEATRQAALDAVTSALSAVAEQVPALPDVIHDRADRILARAIVMQIEIDRFLTASRVRPGAHPGTAGADSRRDASTRRGGAAAFAAAAFTTLEARRTTCRGGSHRKTIFK